MSKNLHEIEEILRGKNESGLIESLLNLSTFFMVLLDSFDVPRDRSIAMANIFAERLEFCMENIMNNYNVDMSSEIKLYIEKLELKLEVCEHSESRKLLQNLIDRLYQYLEKLNSENSERVKDEVAKKFREIMENQSKGGQDHG